MSVSVGIGALLILGIIAVVAYYFIFRKVANRKLEERTRQFRETVTDETEEEFILKPESTQNTEPVHNRLADPSSVSNGVVLGIILVLLIVSVLTSIAIDDRLKNMENMYNQDKIELYSQIASLENKVTEQEKKLDSPFASLTYTYGDYDPATHSAEITFRVVPKEISEDGVITIDFGGRTEVFTKSGNAYICTVRQDLFDTYTDYPVLAITSQGMTMTYESPELSTMNLYAEYLPLGNIFTEYNSGSVTDNSVEENFRVNVYVKGGRVEASLTNIRLVTEKNGKVVYEDKLEENAPGSLFADYDRKIAIEPGDTVGIYLVSEDSLGYTYKQLIVYPVGGVMGWDDSPSEWIFDANGNVLLAR